MDDLPADLREFLQTQPFLELTETKRVIRFKKYFIYLFFLMRYRPL